MLSSTPTPTPQVQDAIDTLGRIGLHTGNDAIVVIVVLAIVFLAVFIPWYIAYTKNDKDRRQQYIDREDRILQVIEHSGDANMKIAESNTKVAEAIAGLKITMDMTSKNCDVCKVEQLEMLRDIQYKQDDLVVMMTKMTILQEEGRNRNENSGKISE